MNVVRLFIYIKFGLIMKVVVEVVLVVSVIFIIMGDRFFLLMVKLLKLFVL